MPFTEDVWDWWKTEIQKLFPEGGTALGTAEGWWHGHTEANKWVIMILNSEDKIEQVRSFLKKARAREKFNQEKMYFDYHLTHYEEVS